MTVKQLIEQLQVVPKDAIVTICNDDTYNNGTYKVTGIVYYDLNFVEVVTDYESLAWEE